MLNLTTAQNDKLVAMYISMLDFDTNQHGIGSIQLQLRNNLSFMLEINNYFDNIFYIFKSIIYTKSYYYANVSDYGDMEPLLYTTEQGDYKAKPLKLVECLNQIFEFDTVVYALFYAEDHIKLDINKKDEFIDELYLLYVLQYIFNIDNIQDTYFKEEV